MVTDMRARVIPSDKQRGGVRLKGDTWVVIRLLCLGNVLCEN